MFSIILYLNKKWKLILLFKNINILLFIIILKASFTNLTLYSFIKIFFFPHLSHHYYYYFFILMKSLHVLWAPRSILIVPGSFFNRFNCIVNNTEFIARVYRTKTIMKPAVDPWGLVRGTRPVVILDYSNVSYAVIRYGFCREFNGPVLFTCCKAKTTGWVHQLNITCPCIPLLLPDCCYRGYSPSLTVVVVVSSFIRPLQFIINE